jgi:hypothetical protein
MVRRPAHFPRRAPRPFSIVSVLADHGQTTCCTGMDKLHTSMATYIKTMSMRKEADDKEKMLPVDVLAHAMISHGEEFESDSLFGTCLMSTCDRDLTRRSVGY